MGEPEPANYLLSNHTISWPSLPVGIAPLLATEWVTNTGSTPLTIGRPSVTSSSPAGEYSLAGDNCPAALSPGQRCTIRIGYSPRGAGSRVGTLFWPIGGQVAQVALRGQSPDGFTEITSTGRNAIDQGLTAEFIEGKYVQMVARGDVHAISIKTTTTEQYQDTKWSRGAAVTLAAPIGQTLRVGTFHTEAAVGTNQWGFNVGNDEFCGSLTGTLTIRQLEFSPVGWLSRADMTFQGTCDLGLGIPLDRYYSGPLTAHIRYRSTVSHPEYVTGPAQVTEGQTVPISGVTSPGATVGIWFRKRLTSTFSQLRTLEADSAGRFATSYTALDDYVYYAKMGDYLPVQNVTQIKPTMTATESGGIVTLSGTTTPGEYADLVFSSGGQRISQRYGKTTSPGHWIYRYLATKTYDITAQDSANQVFANPITVPAAT